MYATLIAAEARCPLCRRTWTLPYFFPHFNPPPILSPHSNPFLLLLLGLSRPPSSPHFFPPLLPSLYPSPLPLTSSLPSSPQFIPPLTLTTTPSPSFQPLPSPLPSQETMSWLFCVEAPGCYLFAGDSKLVAN